MDETIHHEESDFYNFCTVTILKFSLTIETYGTVKENIIEEILCVQLLCMYQRHSNKQIV